MSTGLRGKIKVTVTRIYDATFEDLDARSALCKELEQDPNPTTLESMSASRWTCAGSAPKSVRVENTDNLRLIDALQLPAVIDGSKWIARFLVRGETVPAQTLGVDTSNGKMYWCDRLWDARAVKPTYFGAEAALTLRELLGPCTLVEARKESKP